MNALQATAGQIMSGVTRARFEARDADPTAPKITRSDLLDVLRARPGHWFSTRELCAAFGYCSRYQYAIRDAVESAILAGVIDTRPTQTSRGVLIRAKGVRP